MRAALTWMASDFTDYFRIPSLIPPFHQSMECSITKTIAICMLNFSMYAIIYIHEVLSAKLLNSCGEMCMCFLNSSVAFIMASYPLVVTK